MILAIITLLTALTISGVAAYFSITGLAALFSASFWSVVIMAGSIEIGKLVAAAWLKANWANNLISRLHKFYLVCAVIICMFITSLGIFGFLSKAHFEQNAPVQKDLVQIEAVKEQVEFKTQELQIAYKQLEELNKTIIPGKRQWSLEQERRSVQTYIKKLNEEIQVLKSKLLTNKENISAVDIKLGPVKYLADLIFGDAEANIDRTIQLLILTIMFVFDPLAIVLLISAVVSFQQIKKSKEIEAENASGVNLLGRSVFEEKPRVVKPVVIAKKEVPIETPVVQNDENTTYTGKRVSKAAKPGEHLAD